MGQSSSTEARTTNQSLLSRSTQSLRRIAASLGGATAVSAIAAAETAARELSKAERLRRRRRRERDEDRDEEREERLQARRKRRRDDDDDDGDDDAGDRISIMRAKHAALVNRNSGGERRVNSKQTADDDESETAAERKARRQAERDDDSDADSDDGTTVTKSPQFAPDLGLSDSSSTDTGSDRAEIRIGDSDSWASIDPETGTATAFSNGVSAIAGPDGAEIEGSPSGTGTSVGRSADDLDSDGNDDGDFGDLVDPDDPDDDGGNNDDDLLS